MGETKAGSPPGIPKPKKAGIRRISGPGRKKSDPRSAHAYSLITHRDGNAKLQRVAANRPESYTAFAEQSMELNGSPPFSSPFADEGTNFAREQVAAMRDPASHHLLPFPPPYQPVAKPEPAEPSPPPIDPARCSSTELDSWLIAVVLSIPPPTASTSSTKSGATTSQKARRYFLAREAQLNCAFEVLQRAIGLLQQHMRDLHYNSEVLSAYYEAIEEDVEIGTSKTHKDSRFHYYMREEKRVAPQQQYNLSKEDLRERLDKLYFVTSKLESAEGLDSFDNTRLSSYESTLTGKQILKKRMLLFGSMGTTGLLGTGGSRSEDDDGRHGVKFALPPGHHKSANSYDSARRTPSGDTSSDSDDQDDGFEGSAERHAARAQRQRLLRALSKQTKKLESQLHLPCAPSEIASRMRNELILSFSARVLALKDSKRGEGGEAHVEPFVEWYVNEIMDPFAMSHLLRMVPMGYVVTTTCRVVYACDSRNSLSSSNALPDLAHVVLQAIKEGREEALMQFCMSPSVSFLSALNSPLNTMLIIYAALFLGHLDVVRRLVRQGFFHSQALMTLIFLHANWDDTDYVFYQRRDLQIVWNETLKANQRRHERGNRRSSMPADSSTVGPPSRPNTMVGADEFPLDLGGSTSYGAAEGGTSKALSAISEVVSSWHLEDDQLPSESIANADAIGKLSDMGQSGQSVVYGSVQRLRLLLELRKHYVHRHEENLVNQYEALRESAMKHSTRSSTVFASADVPVTQVLAKEFLNRKRSNKSLLEGDEMEDDDFEDGLGTDTLSHLLGSGRLDSLTAYPLCCTMVPAFSSPVLCRCTPWSYAPIQPTQSPLLLRVDAPINIRTAKQIIRHAYPIDVELEEKEREEQEEKAHRRKGLYSQNAEEPRTRRISTDPAHVVERSFYFEAHLALDFLLGGPELHPSVSTTPAAASAASYEHGFASTTSPTISTHDTGLSKSPSGDVIHPTAENQIVIGCCTEAVAMEANGCAGGHTKTFSALGRDEESFGISFKVLRRRMLPTFDENGEVRDEEEVVLQVMRHQHGNVSELAFPDPSRSRTTITSMLDAHRGTSTSTSRPAAEAAAHGDLLQTRDYRRSGKPMLLRMISHVDGTSNTHSHSASSEFTLDFTFGGASSAGHNEMGVSGAGAGEVDPSTVAPEGKLLSFPQVTLLDRDELEELDRAEERREMESGANNNGFETSSVNRDQAEPSATPRGTKVSDRLENSRMQPFFGGTDADDRMGTHFLSDVEVDVTEELIPCTNSLSLLGSLGLVIGFLYDPAKNTITVLVNGVSLGVVFAGVGVLAPACKSLYPAATLQANRELVSRLRAVSEGVKLAVINFGFDPNNLFAVHTLLPALTVKAPKESPPQALETSVSPAERPTSGRTVAFEPQLATKSARGPSAEQPVKDPGQDEDGDDEEEEVEVLPRILDADHKFMHLVDALTTIEEYDDQSTSGKGKSSQSSSRNSGAADELLANNAQLDDSKGFLEPMAHKVTVFRVQQMLNQASRGGFYDMLSYAPVYVRRYSRDPLDTARVNGVPIIPFRARLTPLCAAIAARQRTMAYVIATHPLTCFHNFSNQTVEERKSALLAASVLGYHEVVQVLLERMALHEILELFCLRLERESMQTMQRDFQRRAISVMRQYIYNSSSQGATAAAAHAARAEDPPATNYLINQACRTALSLNGLYCTRHASYTPLHCALLGGDHTLCVTALLNFLFSILTHARITKRTPAPPEQDKPAGFHSTRSEPNVYEDADQMEAEKKEQAELSSSLIAEAININTRVGESALFIAIRYSNREVCERLLRLGANPACKSSVSHAYGLEIACTNGHVPITKALLATDAYANSAVALNHAGVATPLCWCALNNMSEVITMLLAKGADPKISLDGNAPLLLAVTFRSQEAALALLDGCITVGESKREAAAHGGDASPSFSKPVIDVDAIDSRSQCTSLHIACELGQTAVVKALIRRDASFNVYSKAHFYTPLHTAILNGRDEVAMILLEHAKDKLRRGHCVLDVSSIDNNGNTALHLAAKKGMTHVVEYMLLQFSEEEIQRLTTIRAFTKSPTPIPYLRTNNQGKTALLLAIQAKKVDTAELIISLTTDNATNPGGPVVEGTCMAVLHAASGRLDRVVLMMLAHPLFEASEAFREQFMESYNARRDEIDRKEEANVSGPLKGEKSEGDASRHRQLSLSNKKLYPLPPSEARKYRASVAEERRFINTNYTSHLMMRTRRHTVQTWKRHLHHKKKSGTWQSTLKSQESSLPVTLTKRGTSTLGSDSQDNRRRRSSYVRMLLARVEESLPPDRTLQLLLRGFCLPELYIMLEEVSRESAVVGIQNPAAMMYGESIIGFLQEHFKMTVGPTRVVIFCKEVLHYLTGALHHAVEVGELDALPKWFDRCEEMRKALTRYPPFCQDVIRVVRLYGRTDDSKKAIDEIKALAEAFRARETAPSHMHVLRRGELVVGEETEASAKKLSFAFTEEHFRTPFNYTVMQLVASLGLPVMVHFLSEFFHLSPLHCPSQEQRQTTLTVCSGGDGADDGSAPPSSATRRRKQFLLLCEVEPCDPIPDVAGLTDRKWWFSPYRLAVLGRSPPTVDAFAFIFADMLRRRESLRGSQRFTSESWSNNNSGSIGVPPPPPVDLPISIAFLIDYKEPHWVDPHQRTALQEVLATQFLRASDDGQTEAEMELYRQRVNRQEFEVTQTMHGSSRRTINREHIRRNAMNMAMLLLEHGAAASGKFDAYGKDAWLTAVTMDSKPGSIACSILFRSGATLLGCWGDRVMGTAGNVGSEETASVAREMIHDKERLLQCWRGMGYGINLPEPERVRLLNSGRDVGDDFDYGLPRVDNGPEFSFRAPGEAAGRCADEDSYSFRDDVVLSPDKFSMLRREETHNSPTSNTNGQTPAPFEATGDESAMGVASISTRPATAVGRPTTDLTQDEMNATSAPSPSHACMQHRYRVFILFACAEHVPHHLIRLLDSFPTLLQVSALHPFTGDSLLTRVLRKAQTRLLYMDNIPSDDEVNSMATRLTTCARNRALEMSGVDQEFDAAALRSGSARPGARRASPLTVDPVGSPRDAAIESVNVTMPAKVPRDPSDIPAVWNLLEVTQKLLKRREAAAVLYHMAEDSSTPLSIAARIGYVPLISQIVCPVEGSCATAIPSPGASQQLQASVGSLASVGILSGEGLATHRTAAYGEGNPSDSPRGMSNLSLAISQVRTNAPLTANLMSPTVRIMLACGVYYGEEDAQTVYTILSCIVDDDERVEFLRWVYPNLHPLPAIRLAADYAASASVFLTPAECSNAFWVNILFAQYVGELNNISISSQTWNLLLRVLLPGAPSVPIYLIKKHALAGSSTTVSTRRTTSNAAESQTASSNTSPSRRSRQKGPGFRNWTFLSRRTDIFLQLVAITAADSLMPGRTAPSAAKSKTSGNAAASVTAPPKKRKKTGSVFPGLDDLASKGAADTLLGDVIELCVRFDNVPLLLDLVQLRLPEQLNAGAAANPPPTGGRSGKSSRISVASKSLSTIFSHCSSLSHLSSAYQATQTLQRLQAALWKDLFEAQRIDLLAVAAGSIQVLRKLYDLPESSPYLSPLRYDRVDAMTGLPEGVSFPKSLTQSSMDHAEVSSTIPGGAGASSTALGSKYACSEFSVVSRVTEHRGRILHQANQASADAEDDNTLQEDDIDFARSVVVKGATLANAQERQEVTAVFWGVGLTSKPVDFAAPPVTKVRFIETEEEKATAAASAAAAAAAAQAADLAGTPPPSGPVLRGVKRVKTPGQSEGGGGKSKTSPAKPSRSTSQSSKASRLLSLVPVVTEPPPPPPKWFMYLQGDWAMHAALVLQSPRPSANAIEVLLFLMDRRAPLSVSTLQMLFAASYPLNHWYTSYGDLLTISYQTRAHEDTLLHLLVINNQCQLAEYYLAFCLYYFSNLHYDEPNLNPGRFGIRELPASSDNEVMAELEEDGEDEFGNRLPDQPLSFLRLMLKRNVHGLSAFDYAQSAGMVQLLQQYGCVPPSYRPNPKTFCRALGLRALLGGGSRVAIKSLTHKARRELNAAAAEEAALYFQVPRIILASENFASLQDGDNAERINRAVGIRGNDLAKKRYEKAKLALFHLATQGGKGGSAAGSEGGSSRGGRRGERPSSGHPAVTDAVLLRHLLATQKHTGSSVLPILLNEDVSLLHIGLCSWDDELVQQYSQSQRGTTGTSIDELRLMSTDSTGLRSPTLDGAAMNAAGDLLSNEAERSPAFSTYALGLLPPSLHPPVPNTCTSPTHANAPGGAANVRGAGAGRRESLPPIAGKNSPETPNPGKPTKVPERLSQRDVVQLLEKRQFTVFPLSLPPPPPVPVQTVPERKGSGGGKTKKAAKSATEGSGSSRAGAKGGAKATNVATLSEATFLQQAMTAHHADVEEVVEESAAENEAALMVSMTPMQLAQSSGAVKSGPMVAAVMAAANPFMTLPINSQIRRICDLSFLPATSRMLIQQTLGIVPGHAKEAVPKGLPPKTVTVPVSLHSSFAPCDKESPANVAQQLEEWVSQHRVKQLKAERKKKAEADGTVDRPQSRRKKSSVVGTLPGIKGATSITAEPQPEVANPDAVPESYLDKVMPVGGVATAEQQTLMRALVRQFATSAGAKLSKDLGLTVVPNYDVEATGDAMAAVRVAKNTNAKYSAVL